MQAMFAKMKKMFVKKGPDRPAWLLQAGKRKFINL